MAEHPPEPASAEVPAAEAGADEVSVAPASEERPARQPDEASGRLSTWWLDEHRPDDRPAGQS